MNLYIFHFIGAFIIHGVGQGLLALLYYAMGLSLSFIIPLAIGATLLGAIVHTVKCYHSK